MLRSLDAKLIFASILLLTIQIFLLVADVDIFPSFAQKEPSLTETIGVIASKKQNVKRRGQGTIVWEDSDVADHLKSYDSVLTMEGSAAQLNLKYDVQIELHENTLVVLEPPEDQKEDSLRIHFWRGNFLSRTQRQKLQVGSGDWSLNAAPGTAMSLKSLENEEVEVEVSSGSVQIANKKTGTAPSVVEKGHRFVLSDRVVSSVQNVTDTLTFDQNKNQRLYAHDFPAQFLVSWQGDARSLRIVGPDKKIARIEIKNPEDKQKVIEFHPGTYYISLANSNNQTSNELVLQVFTAPRIRYTAPLPRDRLIIGESNFFSWLPVEGAVRYILELTDVQSTRERFPTELNRYTASPKLNGESHMRVWGVDDGGFRIPPYYDQTLYMVTDPLAAPKLLDPKLRTPASERSRPANPKPPKNPNESSFRFHWPSWLDLLIGSARAHAEKSRTQTRSLQDVPKRLREIQFQWQPVPEADFYLIEISPAEDFLSLTVSEKIPNPHFEWSGYDKQIYYWRVAGGTHSGRMGLFSEVGKMDLSKIETLREGEIAPGVTIKAMDPLLSKKTPKILEIAAPNRSNLPKTEILKTENLQLVNPVLENSKSEDPKSEDLKPEGLKSEDLKSEEPETKNSGPLTYKKSYAADVNLHHVNHSLKKGYTAALQGFADTSFNGRMNLMRSDGLVYQFYARATFLTWKPEDARLLPFQNDISSMDFDLQGLYVRPQRDLNFGLIVHTLTILKRIRPEELKGESAVLLGPAAQYYTKVSNAIDVRSVLGIAGGASIAGVAAYNEMNYYLKLLSRDVYLGGDLDFKIYFGDEKLSGFNLTTGLHIGTGF